MLLLIMFETKLPPEEVRTLVVARGTLGGEMFCLRSTAPSAAGALGSVGNLETGGVGSLFHVF